MKKKILLCLIALMMAVLGGCAMLEHKDAVGNVTRYLRIGPQSIGDGSITLPDGSVLNFEEQNAELPKVEITATSIIIGKKVMP